ncbi:hypothetical protein ANCCAN_05640, partial [Ancylostoma caninum]
MNGSGSLRNSKFVRTAVEIFRNTHVNFLITSCLILFFLYLTVLAAFGRNIIHPFTGDEPMLLNLTHPSVADSASLITSAFSIFFLLIISLCVGQLFDYMSLPPL